MLASSTSVERRSICKALRKPPIRKSCCIRMPSEIVHDPDPAIYDQRLLFETGGAPSFNSPDIDTVDIWPLRPIDNLAVTCRNLSGEASANRTRLDLSWSVFFVLALIPASVAATCGCHSSSHAKPSAPRPRSRPSPSVPSGWY